MNAQQIEALKMMLHHYSNDPRVECLLPLVAEVRTVEDPFLAETPQIIPPVDGWRADTLYLVKVSYSKENPVHDAFLHVGFLDENNQPGNYSEIWVNSYDDAILFHDAFYLRVVKELHEGMD